MKTATMDFETGQELFKRGYYLTDGGLETTLIFHEGKELPYFAAFNLVCQQEGRNLLRRYYGKYLQIAESQGTHFVLETPTWRASKEWGEKMGYVKQDLDAINRLAIRFLQHVRTEWRSSMQDILISGCLGPRGDGYQTDRIMTVEEAFQYHLPQIMSFAQQKADLVSAFTMNYVEEAIGIVKAAKSCGVPVVISFTVETNGYLPSGQALKAAIEQVDQQTKGYVTHFMINCAHPSHFRDTLEGEAEWKNRIGGIRANASCMSHAELDEAEHLDDGNPLSLAQEYQELQSLLPGLKVLGGCCGTDHRHVGLISQHLSLN